MNDLWLATDSAIHNDCFMTIVCKNKKNRKICSVLLFTSVSEQSCAWVEKCIPEI